VCLPERICHAWVPNQVSSTGSRVAGVVAWVVAWVVAASPRVARPSTPVAPTAAAPAIMPLRLNFTLSPFVVPGAAVKAKA
jgi:hypothetical protein